MKHQTASGTFIEREALLRNVQHTWEEYQKTGLHLTMEEADEWLAQLEAGRDVELPACHT